MITKTNYDKNDKKRKYLDDLDIIERNSNINIAFDILLNSAVWVNDSENTYFFELSSSLNCKCNF